MKAGPLSVGVMIAAKNAEATIGKAVSSCLAQQHIFEIIVVDDGSTDATLAAATAAAQGSPLLRTIVFPQNRGPAAARNAALETTSAQAVCVVDADDYLLPGRVAKMVANFPGCDFLADDMYFASNPDGPVLERKLFSLAPNELQWLSLADFVDRSISRRDRPRGEIGFIKPLMSVEFLRSHNLAYRENMRLGEDFALYAEALHAGARFGLMEACGYVAVERSDSLSARHTIDDLRHFLEFDDELLSRPVSPRERSAIGAHRTNTAVRLVHREVLKAKRERKFLKMAELFLQTPQIGSRVALAILRDKMSL